MKVCVAPFNVLSYPEGGGHAWVYINWSLGLQAQGCDVVWLESFWRNDKPEEALQQLCDLQANLDAVGLRAPIALLLSEQDRAQLRPIADELARRTVSLETVVEEAALLLNFNYSLDSDVVGKFKRTALVDIDPGLLQIWVGTGKMQLAQHDMYFSIGETVSTPAARFPDCGLRWHYTPPPVFLPAWSPTRTDATAPYTTISDWWGEWMEFNGEVYSNDKRASFLDYLDLPSLASVPLELALCMAEDDEEDRQSLRRSGWRIRHAWEVSSTPERYRTYIQQSRGEFSCAKPSCMRLQNAWISDRTLAYLASGKPAIVQHTGPSSFLPDAAGLFRFRTLDEAAGALSTAESDYERHSRLARALTEEYFDAQKVVRRVLERAIR